MTCPLRSFVVDAGRLKSYDLFGFVQSVVVDAETERRLTKQNLVDKTGIAPQQQRLLFPNSGNEGLQHCATLPSSGVTPSWFSGVWEVRPGECLARLDPEPKACTVFEHNLGTTRHSDGIFCLLCVTKRKCYGVSGEADNQVDMHIGALV
jgi:hypothetical protein